MEGNSEPRELDQSTLSLPEKLGSKIWKARRAGLEELREILESSSAEDTSIVSKYKDILSKTPSDINVLVVEAGLDAILVYISKWKLCPKFRAFVLPQIIVKCLCSNRSSLSTSALEVLMIYIEIGSGMPFVMEKLCEALANKTPRVVVSVLNAMSSIVTAYGSEVVDIKFLLENIVKCFDHKDVLVRKATAALVAETYRWIKESVWDTLNGLKKLQIKEIKDAISRVPKEQPTPIRFLRSYTSTGRKYTSEGGNEHDTRGDVVEDTQNDPYAYAKAVNIADDPTVLSLIDSLDNIDWKLRKEALDQLLKIFTVMKIESGNFWPIIKKLLKKMTDTNVNVCASSIECLVALCLGLRSNFAVYKSHAIATSIEKLKEKRKIVLDPLRELLDSLFLISSEFGSVLESLNAGITHKNPQVRSEVVFWITRSIKVYRGTFEKPTISSLLEISLKAISDSDKTVRENAAKLLACLVKTSNDNNTLKKITSTLDKQKVSRVVEHLNSVQLDLPTKYENEEYLRARGVTVNVQKHSNDFNSLEISSPLEKKDIIREPCDTDMEIECKTRTSQVAQSYNPSVENVFSHPYQIKSNDSFPREMHLSISASDNSQHPQYLDAADDEFRDAQGSTKISLILLNTSTEQKQKRTFFVPEDHKIIPGELKKILKSNSDYVLGPEIYSVIVNMDNESEHCIIEILEKILQPISQRPESIEHAASQLNIESSVLEERYINSSDVLFLICVSLLSKKTYSITMRCLLLIQTLFFFVESKNYTFTEFEAKILSFSLLTGVKCENNDMSTMVSALFRKLTRSYPELSVVKYIYDVLSLHPDARKQCIEELTYLTTRSNDLHCPEKLVPIASTLLNEQDQELRNCGGSLLDYIYSKIGDGIYDYICDSPEIIFKLTRSYLMRSNAQRCSNEIFEFSHDKTPPVIEMGVSIPSPQSVHSVKKPKNVDGAYVCVESTNDNEVIETPKVSTTMSPLLYYQPSVPITRENLSKLSPEIQSIIARLSMRDHANKINALKDLEKIMVDESSLAQEGFCVIILTSSLIHELKYAVSYILNDESTIGRLCKHLINVLAKIFCCDIVQCLDENSLKHTFVGILDLLLELSFTNAEPCQQLSKVLNVLVIRILDNADRTQSFKVLIAILREFLMPELQLSSEFVVKHKNIAELVMKCLWKITKNIDDLIKQKKVDVAQLLFNCHEFLEYIPPIEWKRRSHKKNLFQEELPLKTIKTIMKELIKSLGNDILNHTTLIPYPDQSYAVSYIKQALKNVKQ